MFYPWFLRTPAFPAQSPHPIALPPLTLVQIYICTHGPFDIVANFAARKHVRAERDVFSIDAMCETNVFMAKKLLDLLLDNPPEAGEAIRNEVEVLKKLMATPLCAQVPVVQGDVGTEGAWTWSVQSVLPKGKSPVRMQREHYAFLDELKKLGISHGDFAPWNCSIVGGKLFVYDWEDAGPWKDGKDESWFKGQVKKLLGIDA